MTNDELRALIPYGYIHESGRIKTDDGWVMCDGRALNKGCNPKTWAALGYTYGGEGDTFNLPDLRALLLPPLVNDRKRRTP